MSFIKDQINQILESILPYDEIEKNHLDFVKTWLESDSEIFRIEKPDNPPIHLVSYFVVVDPATNEFLLVDHKLSGLWLPSGGHAELNEHPKETVKREVVEELGIEADFLLENPLFISVSQTVGSVKAHTDVSFWYVLKYNKEKPLFFDRKEFNQVRWFHRNEIPYECSDPHMKRFVDKAIKKIATLNSYESSVTQYSINTEHLYPKEDALSFAKLLPHEKSIIDLGCGNGRDAEQFVNLGLKVTGIDLSPKMISAAQQKVPQGNFHVMDLENFQFPRNSFNGAWANCSLLHIPKGNIATVLNNINVVLKQDAILYLAVKKNDYSESLEPDHRYNGIEKFWSYYQEDELKGLLSEAGFEVLNLTIQPKNSNYQSHPLIKILAKKTRDWSPV